MIISKLPIPPRLIIFILRCLGWICVGVIAILSLVPGSARPHIVATGQLEHIAAYAGTAALLAAAYSEKKQFAAISILLPIYAACLETLQIWVPGRTAQIIDVFASAIGSWIGIVLVLLLQSWRRSRIDRTTSS